jgi:hypothetical protein
MCEWSLTSVRIQKTGGMCDPDGSSFIIRTHAYRCGRCLVSHILPHGDRIARCVIDTNIMCVCARIPADHAYFLMRVRFQRPKGINYG